MTTLKKLFLIAVLFNTVLISAVEATELWSRRYNRADTYSKKNSIIVEILEQNDSSLNGILSDALRVDILSNLHNSKNINDESDYITFARTLVLNLGLLNIKDSADDIYELFQNHSDPYLKADCLTAIGDMKVEKFTKNISYLLQQLNSRSIEGFSSNVDQYDQSIIAYSAIYALDKLADETTYEVILKSTLSWYPDRVTEFASEVLARLTEDPVKQLVLLLQSGDLNSKKAAIDHIYICKDTDENKMLGARRALELGHINSVSTVNEETILLDIRKKALLTYIKYGSDADDVYYLTKSLENGNDLEEKLYAIQALRINKSGDSTFALSKVLMDFNFRNYNSFGLTNEEQDVVRALMDNLGLKGDQNGYEALHDSTLSNYTPGIVKHATKAIEMLNL